jgi:transitional endoplasmic reticulum ATPase
MELDVLKAALAASPDNIPLLGLVAKALEDNLQWDEAARHYERMARLAPDHAGAVAGIARMLAIEGRTSEGILRLEDYLRRQPDAAPVHLELARLHLQENDGKSARIRYDKAVALERGLADDKLLGDILAAGGSPAGKVAASTDGASFEFDAGGDHGGPGPDDVLARELDLEFRIKPDVDFSKVGGMETVKEQIRLKIILPLQNPALFAAYGRKAGGGVMLYGPPGCGKTLIAKATAAEIGSSFFAVGIHNVLDMYIGQSEQKLHQIFELARRNQPAVLFFDEVDAMAADRRDMKLSAGRHLINQFLAELDGAQADNDGLLVLGATNAPWHVDGAFLRPGRFDRILFVPPPDEPARTEIANILAAGKPIAGFDPADLARHTGGFSGADLKAVFDTATERAIASALKSGKMEPITGRMLVKIARDSRPTTARWFESARNHALYANQGGLYDDVLTYLRIKK